MEKVSMKTKFYCTVHNREATHFEDGEWRCDPKLGGIMLACRVRDFSVFGLLCEQAMVMSKMFFIDGAFKDGPPEVLKTSREFYAIPLSSDKIWLRKSWLSVQLESVSQKYSIKQITQCPREHIALMYVALKRDAEKKVVDSRPLNAVALAESRDELYGSFRVVVDDDEREMFHFEWACVVTWMFPELEKTK